MRLAAVSYDSSGGALVDEVFAEAALFLRRDGVRLAGAIQLNESVADRRRCKMTLEDLASGRRILASEDRGPHARGCLLDASALEEAAELAAVSIDPSTDLIIVNRFGKQEAAGRGFRQVMETGILLDRPVLAGVSLSNRESWEAFTGGGAEYLPPSLEMILQWCRDVLAERH